MSTPVVKDDVTKEKAPVKEIKLAEVKEIKLDPIIPAEQNYHSIRSYKRLGR